MFSMAPSSKISEGMGREALLPAAAPAASALTANRPAPDKQKQTRVCVFSPPPYTTLHPVGAVRLLLDSVLGDLPVSAQSLFAPSAGFVCLPLWLVFHPPGIIYIQ